MGGCGSKSNPSGATAPVPYGRSSLRVNVGGNSSAGPHPPTPNVFAHLGIGGLDEDGNVKAMRVGRGVRLHRALCEATAAQG